MATVTNFDVKKGYTFKKSISFLNAKTETPVDLTGCTISGEIKKGTLVVPYEVVMIAAAEGKFRIRLTDEVTAGLAATEYSSIVRIQDPDGDITPLFEGVMKVLP